jgi:hypothetical protein
MEKMNTYTNNVFLGRIYILLLRLFSLFLRKIFYYCGENAVGLGMVI